MRDKGAYGRLFFERPGKGPVEDGGNFDTGGLRASLNYIDRPLQPAGGLTDENHMKNDSFILIKYGLNFLETNYFDTEAARRGIYFTSWNAGGLSLLVPDNQRHFLALMASAKNVAITRGRLDGHEVYEILFDDETDASLAICIDVANSDFNVAEESHGKALEVYVFTRSGCEFKRPGRFRVAPVPCLKPFDWMPPSEPRWRQG